MPNACCVLPNELIQFFIIGLTYGKKCNFHKSVQSKNTPKVAFNFWGAIFLFGHTRPLYFVRHSLRMANHRHLQALPEEQPTL